MTRRYARALDLSNTAATDSYVENVEERTVVCPNCGDVETLFFQGRDSLLMVPTQKFRQNKRNPKNIFHACKMGTYPVRFLADY